MRWWRDLKECRDTTDFEEWSAEHPTANGVATIVLAPVLIPIGFVVVWWEYRRAVRR